MKSDGITMFDLKTPCSNCPFTRARGHLFRLNERRIRDIVAAPAFPCHKTVDYDASADSDKTEFKKAGPRQCAGLMSVLHKSGQPNQIMQVGQRLGEFDPNELDHSATYDTLEELITAHGG